MKKNRLTQIEKEIEKIKQEFMGIGVIRPGSLTQQYRYPKERKGGYYQLSYTHKMKSRTEYVRPAFVKEIRGQIDDYKRFRKLVDKWIVLGIEYSKLRMEIFKSET